VRRHPIEMLRSGFHRQQREQGIDRVRDRPDQRDVDGHPPADLLRPNVDLDHWHTFWIESAVGKVGAEHQQRVAVLHRPVARAEADQPGHADVVGVVVLDELLTPHRVHHGRLQRRCYPYELVVRAGTPGPGQDRHAA
jgi:hypothetical protein